MRWEFEEVTCSIFRYAADFLTKISANLIMILVKYACLNYMSLFSADNPFMYNCEKWSYIA